MVREARHNFLNKKCWHTFKGYAYSMIKRITIKKEHPQKAAVMEKILKFEEEHSIPRETIFSQVEYEMKRRGFL